MASGRMLENKDRGYVWAKTPDGQPCKYWANGQNIDEVAENVTNNHNWAFSYDPQWGWSANTPLEYEEVEAKVTVKKVVSSDSQIEFADNANFSRAVKDSFAEMASML